jgi:hypothetical protein
MDLLYLMRKEYYRNVLHPLIIDGFDKVDYTKAHEGGS